MVIHIIYTLHSFEFERKHRNGYRYNHFVTHAYVISIIKILANFLDNAAE